MKQNKIFKDNDVDLNVLKDRSIGIIGYGNQAKAQSLNLRDSGFNVSIGLRENSSSIKEARSDGFNILSIKDLIQTSEVVSLLIPDEQMGDFFLEHISPYLIDGQTLLFSHAYSIHFKHILPPEFIDVILVAPSGSGKMVRNEFLNGRGVPNLIAVHQDFSGNAISVALAYSKAIGGTRTGAFLTSFEEEVVTDIFGEQVLLIGSIPCIIKESFNVLLEDGYSPYIAWLVCYYEVKSIIDTFHSQGFDFLNQSISNLAEYGGSTRGKRLINKDTKLEMKRILNEIKDGSFEKEWKKEKNNNYKSLKKARLKVKKSKIEKINQELKKIFFEE